MNEQLITVLATHALDFFLALLLGILMRYLVPFVKAKTEAQELDRTKRMVNDAVAAAEERFVGTKLGLTFRKPWVKELLAGAGVIINEFTDAMIDAAARSLTQATKVVEAAAIQAVAEATDGRVTSETANDIVAGLEAAICPPEGQ